MSVRAAACLALLLAALLPLGRPAPARAQSPVAAEANGVPILRSHVEERIRELHRYRPRVKAEGEASAVDLAEIVAALVDERLMIQEAERLGLDRSGPVRRALDDYASDQAVLRLRQLEVLDKARVDEAEVLAELQARPGAEGMGEEARNMAADHLRKKLLRRRIQERSEAYVAALAEQSPLEVDRELLASLEPGREPRDKDRRVARLGEAEITAREVQAQLDRLADNRSDAVRASHTPADYASWLGRLREAALHSLATPLLVAAEARRRGLDQDPEVLAKTAARREDLLVQALLQEVIAPLAAPSEAEMRAYLAAHPEEFSQDCEFRFAQMRFADQAQAESALEELRQGAGFEYLARQLGGQAPEERSRVWTPGRELAPEVRRELESLRPGETSGVAPAGRGYVLLKLNGRRGGAPLSFAAAQEGLRLAAGRQNFTRIRAEYLERLRESARITIHQDVLEDMEAAFWRPAPDGGSSPAGEP